jgi:hypothetical protein
VEPARPWNPPYRGTRPTVEPATVEPATVEPGEAMEATGAKSEAGEPAEGIAVAIIRPVVVTRPALGIVAAARPDTAVTRGERVSGWADRNRSGGARRRSAQHRRGRKRRCRAGWVRRRYRNDFRVDRDGPDQRKDEGKDADRQRGESRFQARSGGPDDGVAPGRERRVVEVRMGEI